MQLKLQDIVARPPRMIIDFTYQQNHARNAVYCVMKYLVAANWIWSKQRGALSASELSDNTTDIYADIDCGILLPVAIRWTCRPQSKQGYKAKLELPSVLPVIEIGLTTAPTTFSGKVMYPIADLLDFDDNPPANGMEYHLRFITGHFPPIIKDCFEGLKEAVQR
jgi:hypothetical protein